MELQKPPDVWEIPPAVFDYLTTLKGHISAIRTLKQLVDSLKKQIITGAAAGTIQTNSNTYLYQISTIRNHLEEHVSRFQQDFVDPEEPPLEEAIEIVRRGLKQFPGLDRIELAWKLRLTPSITNKALNRLHKESNGGGKSLVRPH